MNILVLSNMFPNSKIYMSGIFVFEQVKELQKKGIEVTVFAPVPLVPPIINRLSAKWSKFREVPDFEIIEGVKIYHTRYLALPGGLLKNYWAKVYYLLMRKKVLKLHKEKNFDIVHAHGSAPDDYGAYLIARYLNLPYINTVHGESVYALYKYPGRFKSTKKALENADAVVGVSSIVVNRIKELTSRKEKLYTILNGFKTADQELVSTSDEDRVSILFAGTLVERKGCRYLLKAFKTVAKKYDNTDLVIAGGGELLESMKELADSLGITGRVRFTGVIPHSEMLQLMADCDIFVLPSWNEAFGVVYLEAMSFKKPVIGAFGEGITDVVKDGENGLLVNVRDVESIVEKLSLLIENAALRETLGLEGYNSIKNLTWERNAAEYVNLYGKVLTDFGSKNRLENTDD